MSEKKLSRRDFLKLSSLVPPAYFAINYDRSIKPKNNLQNNKENKPNIIIIVLDTLSAHNMSLYGYQRNTTPNLEKFARHANVYNSHYSTSNFTTPGTASILTGLYPWSHRATQYGGIVAKDMVQHNLFNVTSSDYTKTAFSQNPWGDLLLWQFSKNINFHIDPGEFNLTHSTLFNRVFPNDRIHAFQGIEGFSLRQISGSPSAQILSTIKEFRLSSQKKSLEMQYQDKYPLGLPYVMNDTGDVYELRQLFTGVQDLIEDLPRPSLAYIHLYPPHGDYHGRYFPTNKFHNKFEKDGLQHPEKKAEVFPAQLTKEEIFYRLQNYDEFISSIDDQFGQLIERIDKDVLNNSYVIITSDHGEMFERGRQGHTNHYLYEALIRVPLLISTPGQSERKDIFNNTSSIDILPTILSIMRERIPTWAEGKILPGFTKEADDARPIYALVAKSTPTKGRLGPFTFSMIKEEEKLICYSGYDGIQDTYEFFNLTNDPDEMVNRANRGGSRFQLMKQEIQELIFSINRR